MKVLRGSAARSSAARRSSSDRISCQCGGRGAQGLVRGRHVGRGAPRVALSLGEPPPRLVERSASVLQIIDGLDRGHLPHPRRADRTGLSDREGRRGGHGRRVRAPDGSDCPRRLGRSPARPGAPLPPRRGRLAFARPRLRACSVAAWARAGAIPSPRPGAPRGPSPGRARRGTPRTPALPLGRRAPGLLQARPLRLVAARRGPRAWSSARPRAPPAPGARGRRPSPARGRRGTGARARSGRRASPVSRTAAAGPGGRRGPGPRPPRTDPSARSATASACASASRWRARLLGPGPAGRVLAVEPA